MYLQMPPPLWIPMAFGTFVLSFTGIAQWRTTVDEQWMSPCSTGLFCLWDFLVGIKRITGVSGRPVRWSVGWWLVRHSFIRQMITHVGTSVERRRKSGWHIHWTRPETWMMKRLFGGFVKVRWGSRGTEGERKWAVEMERINDRLDFNWNRH